MPLDKSGSKESVGKNIKTEMAAGKPQRQAIAIALDVARRNRASGGLASPRHYKAGKIPTHTGPINSAVPGRTDKHNMAVPAGSYVLPAETISHLGQSNTAAGMKVADSMFGGAGPYGVKMSKVRPSKGIGMGKIRKAEGGGIGEPVPVVTAGGEYVIDPSVVTEIGGGDLDRGHQALDAWIMSLREDHIRTLKSLAPPAKD